MIAAGELAGPDGERDIAQDFPAAEPDADPVQPQQFRPGLHCIRFHWHHRCSVETLAVTALSRALTSASIQDW